MINIAKNSIIFSELDMDWIEPLFLEWIKENEGKKREELILDLLREYKLQRENPYFKYKFTLGAYEIRFKGDALKTLHNTSRRLLGSKNQLYD